MEYLLFCSAATLTWLMDRGGLRAAAAAAAAAAGKKVAVDAECYVTTPNLQL